ncbi:MAG: PepSY domain-containing protein [Bacteroidota bacterium]
MIVSTWRYGHFIMAVSSFLFLVVVTVTGVILAFQPVEKELSVSYNQDVAELNIADLVSAVRAEYDEVFYIRKEPHDLVKVSVFHKDESAEFYIDPFTAEELNVSTEERPLYQFAVSLHRSLFLGTTGRVFVGVNSLILLFLCISGMFLIVRKQGGWRRYFNKIEKTRSIHYYHTAIGRFFMLPIALLAITGVYLSLDRFIDFSDYQVSHQVDYEAIEEVPQKQFNSFQLFTDTDFSSFKEIEFPFSEDPEDFYILKLHDREVLISQYSGEVMSEYNYPVLASVSNLVTILHTGDGNAFWAILNAFSSLSVIVFIFTGLLISLKSRATKIERPFLAGESEFVILYGSENGSTEKYAKTFYNELLKKGRKCFIAPLNDFQHFEKLEHLVIFTSTYGLGEAPDNAFKFQNLFVELESSYVQKFSYAVVGFGSKAYPEFCKYAFDVDEILKRSSITDELIEMHTIDNQSMESLNEWLLKWSEKHEIQPAIKINTELLTRKKTVKLTLLEKNLSPNTLDQTFTLMLSNGKSNYQSGDLLGIYAPGEYRERYYSIGAVPANGKNDSKALLLSVKKHEHGVCSSFLRELKAGEQISGFLVDNKGFHLPENTSRVVMVCNGTGIAPFLGMIKSYTPDCKKYLYWGGQNEQSFQLYASQIAKSQEDGNLEKVNTAFSRSGKESTYVQYILEKDADFIAQVLKEGGVIMVCGSNAMLAGVKEVLRNIAASALQQPLDYLESNGQLRYDCY